MHVHGCCIILLQPALLMNSDSADSEADHSAARAFQRVVVLVGGMRVMMTKTLATPLYPPIYIYIYNDLYNM